MANNNENKILNVPHLRFPEFSGEWKKCTLGEIGKGFDYGMNAAAKPFDGQHKYIRITDIDESSAAYIDKDVVSPDGELQDSYLVKANDILLARTGASTGKSYLYDNKDGILYFAGFLIRVNIPSDNAYFVFSQLHLSRYRKWIGIMSARSGQPGVNSQEYSNYPIYLPKIEEQTKIAKLLKLVDERIAAQNKIIEDLKKLKSAIINKLFDNLEGERCTYRELFQIVNDRNKDFHFNKVIAASQEYGMVERDTLNLKVQFDESSINTYKIIRTGDYVVYLRSFQGGFAFSELDGICSPAYIILRPNTRILSYGFLRYYFVSQPFINSLRLVTYGIRDGRSINVEEWMDMPISIPDKSIQDQILKTIQSIDNKLLNERHYLNSLLNERQFFLGNMFI